VCRCNSPKEIFRTCCSFVTICGSRCNQLTTWLPSKAAVVMHRLLCGIDAASRLVMPSCSGAHVCVPHTHEKFNGLFESAISLDVEKALAKHVLEFTPQVGVGNSILPGGRPPVNVLRKGGRSPNWPARRPASIPQRPSFENSFKGLHLRCFWFFSELASRLIGPIPPDTMRRDAL